MRFVTQRINLGAWRVYFDCREKPYLVRNFVALWAAEPPKLGQFSWAIHFNAKDLIGSECSDDAFAPSR